MEMILSGRLYKGVSAAEIGLIHVAVKDDALDAGVLKILEPVLKQPQYALSLAKQAFYASRSRSLKEGLTVESEKFSRCFDHDFFPDLMKQQLREGVLETTADVSKFMDGEK